MREKCGGKKTQHNLADVSDLGVMNILVIVVAESPDLTILHVSVVIRLCPLNKSISGVFVPSSQYHITVFLFTPVASAVEPSSQQCLHMCGVFNFFPAFRPPVLLQCTHEFEYSSKGISKNYILSFCH